MTWIILGVLAVAGSAATVSAEESFTDKIGSAFKSGVDTITRPFKQDAEPKGEPDPTELASPGEPSADSYVAMAKFLEQTGKFELAADQYERALDASPKHLPALLGYARLRDRQDDLNAALELYRTAGEAHPRDGSVPNDVGLCLARRGNYAKAAEALHHAVQLDPNNPRYRANLATVLVDMDRPAEALTQLQAASPPAVAHYNFAFLLNKKGQREAAAFHFRKALELGPTPEVANASRQWLTRLGEGPSQPPAGAPVAVQSGMPAAVPPEVTPGLATAPQAPRGDAQLPPAFAPPYGTPSPDQTSISGAAPTRIEVLPPFPESLLTAARPTPAQPPQPVVLPPTARGPSAPIAPLPSVESNVPRVRPLPPVRE